MDNSLKEKFEQLGRRLELLKKKLSENQQREGELEELKSQILELREKLEQERALRQKVLVRVQDLIHKLEKER